MSEDLYDVVVVGGGAAGLSAGLILAQAQCRMAVVDAGVPRNRFDDRMHGYLSRDGIAPQEFLRLGREEVAGAGGELIEARVVGAQRDGDEHAPRFTLRTDQGQVLRTRRVVVATGLTDELPAVAGLEPYWGHAVFHCPYCHGVHITDDLVVGVLAAGPDSVMEAHLLLQWARRVVLLTDDRVELSAQDRAGLQARGIGVAEGRVVAVEGDGERLTCAVHADGSRTPLDELLVAPTVHVNRTVLDLLGVEVLDENDALGVVLPTDPSGLTSVPGVYAAGNVRASNVQVVEAAAEGLNAAVAVNASLALERAREAVASRGRAGEGGDETPARREGAAGRYREIAAVFTERVRGVRDWDAPTPVSEWRARDVVGHLVGWLPGLLAAGGSDVALAPVTPVEQDPVAAWEEFDQQVQALLDDPASGELLHTDPRTGPQPVSQVIDRFFNPDVALHTWDLARASGQDDTLDPAFVHDALTGMLAQEDLIRGSGQFGEQQPVPQDATEQERLFAFLGRDPRWRP